MTVFKDCTYCKYRLRYPKAIDKKYELERCDITKANIPAPLKGVRYCDQFDCVQCQTGSPFVS